ncbi:probable 2-oxoglutarate-dependent dioxygenase ANS [Pistacia vera]|uniref:probable 2-oxoglutarate-dependent dioxygenase ANS n=1 Tax=Pistacia vera TaxID=55513 RepID=UPI001263C783|nr:probable 2-oxoglutarate-dependent dioxygenase ANS [Pistacia vera]
MEIVSLSKSVPEMAINGDEPPPPPYVFNKQSIFGSIDVSPPYGPFPVIDISLFSPPSSSADVHNELEKLRSALISPGCFQVIGHGISSSFLDKVRELGKQFFELPMEEKKKYARPTNQVEGYGSNMIVSENQVLDWSDRLSLSVFPEDTRNLHYWPQNPSDFREMLNEYAKKVKSVEQTLYKAIAKSLNLEENSFLKMVGERAPVRARFNFYPRCSRPDLVLGVKPHSDTGGITILLQDKDVEGLQVRVDGNWFKVAIIPDALVINLGDQMQIMSNGIFKSPLHRVVTNPEKLRMSVAVVSEAEVDKEIGAVDELVNEERPRLYKNVKNFGAVVYESYQKEQIALDTITA